jgi:hypothetical protein
VADESPEELVTRRIREQLGEGGLQRLIEAQAQLRIGVTAEASAVVVRPSPAESKLHGHTPEVKVQPAQPDDVIAVIESASPELANDIRSRSPQDVNLAINFFLAIMQTLQFLLTVYQIFHQQPPSQTQIIEIFNHTTNVINQTTTTVINMPPHN